MRLGKKIAVLLLTTGLVSCADGGNGSTAEAAVEAAVRQLLGAIHSHDLERILSFVGPSGVSDDDQVLSRNQIATELRDPDSYLSKKLFSDPSVAEIEACTLKPRGTLYVSPAAFVDAYGHQFKVKVNRIEEFAGEHYGIQVYAEKEAVEGCRFELFWGRMKIEDGQVKVGSMFFE